MLVALVLLQLVVEVEDEMVVFGLETPYERVRDLELLAYLLLQACGDWRLSTALQISYVRNEAFLGVHLEELAADDFPEGMQDLLELEAQ